MGEIIGIVSGKGGVGKTTICANLAFCFALQGKKVIAVDGDLGLKNLDILLGLENKSAFDLADILQDRCPINKAIVAHDQLSGLHFIPASASSSAEQIDRIAFRKLCRYLSEHYDYVLLDAPAGVGRGFNNVIYCCDKCIVVATPDLTSIRDAQKTADIIAQYPKLKAWLVINKVRKQLIDKGYIQNIDDIMDSISLPLIGLIAQDDNVLVYSNKGAVLPRAKCISAKCFMNISKRIMGQRVPLLKIWRKK